MFLFKKANILDKHLLRWLFIRGHLYFLNWATALLRSAIISSCEGRRRHSGFYFSRPEQQKVFTAFIKSEATWNQDWASEHMLQEIHPVDDDHHFWSHLRFFHLLLLVYYIFRKCFELQQKGSAYSIHSAFEQEMLFLVLYWDTYRDDVKRKNMF